jgi:hypothetical protein
MPRLPQSVLRPGAYPYPGDPHRSDEPVSRHRRAGRDYVTDFQPSARIIADSISPVGDRLTTLEVRLHRYMLPEFNAHRVFSRSSASSRALSVTRQLKLLTDEPVYPAVWPQERKGMQGGPPLPTTKTLAARVFWDRARTNAIETAEALTELGVHRSVVNRILEPFMAHTIVVTATDWDGFFEQRLPPQQGEPLAQAEIVLAAAAMNKAMFNGVPERLDYDQWHLPYLDTHELKTMHIDTAHKVSVARCARTSYLTQDGKRDVEADLDLFRRLITADPPHWSPLEHVAKPADDVNPRGNFTGWHQLRHTLGVIT